MNLLIKRIYMEAVIALKCPSNSGILGYTQRAIQLRGEEKKVNLGGKAIQKTNYFIREMSKQRKIFSWILCFSQVYCPQWAY